MSFLRQNLSSKRTLSALGVIILFAFLAPDLMAQDAAEGVAADEKKTLMDKIVDAGAFMVPIGILSILMITLAVFNALQLSKKKFCPPALREEILANMSDVRVRSAIDAAAQDPSYLGRMTATAFPLVDATDPESLGRNRVEDAIADFAIRENSRYMSWIGYFSVIAQAAPMIGLFGTVAGMILAFDTMGLSGGANPSELAGNISLALMTTAGGLVVAIPSIFCFYIFKNKFNKLVGEAQETAVEGLDHAIATVNADQQLAKVPEGISEG
ncbi:MAG: MotA/TolQ/ExbB proton channel family protein [Verrucomicrobiales bacterium]|nr:MotA/TolQ/ExbB proton channel family protein [Verrucomicrobiales bacterium]